MTSAYALPSALPPERVGGYVRALRAALSALAPSEEHVPLSRGLGHLGALDPANGGGLLAPAEVTGAGMPAFAWLERARAEAALAAGDGGSRSDVSDAELGRIGRLDPELGVRMRDRRELHRYLRAAELLPATQLVGAVRWLGDASVPGTPAVGSLTVAPPGAVQATLGLAYDRIAPDGRWVRIRAELVTSATASGAMRVDRSGRLQVDDSVRHLLTRHFGSALGVLRVQLDEVTGGQVHRLSRGWLGPFWYPGIALPPGLPAGLGEGLLLHASLEVVDRRLTESRHLDPLEPPEADLSGWHVFRERRFAAHGRALAATQAWSDLSGIRFHVVPMEVAARRL